MPKRKQREFPYMVSVDWLQFYCLQKPTESTEQIPSHTIQGHTLHERPISFADEISDVPLWVQSCRAYTFRRLNHGSKVFKQLWDIMDEKKQVIATAACCPYSSVIKADTVILKIANFKLYEGDLWQFCVNLVQNLGLQYKGITRIDLAYDCNALFNGLNPATLLRGYVNGKWIKKGCQRNWSLNAHQNYNISKATQIDSSEISHTYDGITWGGRKSSVHCQVYNKTKELKEVKDKPHIRREWKKHRIDESKNVWRFEIRIANDGKDLVSLEDGDFFKLGVDFLQDQATIEGLYNAYAQRYFDFAQVHKCSKVSRLKSTRIFCLHIEPIVKCMHPNMKLDDSRYLQGVKNKLADIQHRISAGQLKSSDTYAVEVMEEAQLVIDELIHEKRGKDFRKTLSLNHREYLWILKHREKPNPPEPTEEDEEQISRIISEENAANSYGSTWCD